MPEATSYFSIAIAVIILLVDLWAINSDFLQDKTASLKIHRENGTIQEERTYPRSADPRKSKG
ncbi:hypothetical protein ACYZUA_15410 [Pseudomonas sp. LS2P72]